MEVNNNKIGAFQLGAMSYFLFNALFFGAGIPVIFALSKQDAWIVALISLIIGIIPILVGIYVINYQPNKNIFEKMKAIFGKVFGTIINVSICICIFITLLVVIKNTTSFATTMYLTKTPEIYIALAFMGIAMYGTVKGQETISRVAGILFSFSMVILLIKIIFLVPQFKFDELKPILTDGFGPVFKNSFLFIAYGIIPLFLTLGIAKNDVVKSKNFVKYLIGGMLIGFIHIFLLLFLTPGVISSKVAETYSYPSYYLLRKISIGGAINNVENFIIAHWFFCTFIITAMSLNTILKGLKTTVKIKKEKYYYMIVATVGLVAIFVANSFFKNPNVLPSFMQHTFPQTVFVFFFLLLLSSTIIIFFKKKKEKKATA